jgi:hypothetical protein
LVRKSEDKSILERHRCKREDDIKIYPVLWDGSVVWIDMDKGCLLVDVATSG